MFNVLIPIHTPMGEQLYLKYKRCRQKKINLSRNEYANFGILPIDSQYTFGKNKTYFSAAGGLHCTAYDYFRFAQMMLNKGELEGVRVVSSKAVELMTQPRISGLHGR